MELSLSELRLLREALGTLEAEYGLRAEGEALMVRLRETIERREAEIAAGRW